jgi:hypothetical protein
VAEDIDELNEALARAERAIEDLGLGVTAHVTLNRGLELHFKKRDGRWGLFVHPTARGDEWTPLLKSSKEDRIAAASVLESLVGAMTKEAEKQVDGARAAIAYVEEFLAACRESEPRAPARSPYFKDPVVIKLRTRAASSKAKR